MTLWPLIEWPSDTDFDAPVEGSLLTEQSRASHDDAPYRVQLLSGSIGAVVHGVNLKTELTNQQVAQLRQIWVQRRVIFLPRQFVTPDEHKRFAQYFGELTPAHPVIEGITGHPEVFEIDYSQARQVYAQYGDVAYRSQGLDWHTDVTFVERPPAGSILNAVKIPPAGGDTQWSDQIAAFAALSDSLKAYLRTLTAIHDGSHAFAAQLEKREGKATWDGKEFPKLVPVEHPVVRTHPESGEEILFVNPGFTLKIKELSPAESDALLSFLYAHSTRPEFVVRYHWNEGDIAFWDNRSTQHSVVGDFGTQERVIQRVTIRGDKPL